MTMRPARAGMATHTAVSISGAARCKEFCHENQSPKAPLKSSTQASTGLLPPAQMKSPKSSSAPAIASTGRTMDSSASVVRVDKAMAAPFRGSGFPDDAFDPVVHAFELEGGLLVDLADGDHFLARVVLQRVFEDVEAAGHHRGLHLVGLLLRRGRDHATVGRRLHEALLQATAHEVGVRLA